MLLRERAAQTGRMPEGVIYRHAVESFVNGVILRHGLLSLEFEKELRALGLDVSHPREVDLETWTKLMRAVSARLSPGKSEAEALERVGREQLRGFFDSLVGKGLYLLLRLMGPHRTVRRMAENYRSADSITEVTTHQLGPCRYELIFNTTGGMPDYVRGLLHEAMLMLNVKDPQLTFEVRADGTAFTLWWNE